jgi:Leucine-rich repeat (LRR) protein
MTKKDIHNICKQYNIKNYTINDDSSIDVDGDVYLYNKGLAKLPLKFNKVYGNFACFNNKLTSLEGVPKEVTGYFDCSGNKLTSLEGAPNKVNGDFYCSYNKLTSLEYLPDIKGNLYFKGNPIENKFKGKSTKQIRNYYKLKHILMVD